MFDSVELEVPIEKFSEGVRPECKYRGRLFAVVIFV